MGDILTIIQTIGFPIAVCLMCFWYINKNDEKRHDEVSVTATAVTQMANAVENNTVVLTQVLASLSGSFNIESKEDEIT